MVEFWDIRVLFRPGKDTSASATTLGSQTNLQGIARLIQTPIHSLEHMARPT